MDLCVLRKKGKGKAKEPYALVLKDKKERGGQSTSRRRWTDEKF